VSTAREDILQRVRAAIGKQAADEPVERDYRQTPSLSEGEKIDLFIDRLHDYNAQVYRCGPGEEAATIAEALAARGKTRILIPPGFPAHLLPTGPTFVPDTQLDYREIDATEGALTAATAAIAMTGSLILTHSETEGRRALTLIPDYHLCVVYTNQLVETVPEGLRALGGRRTSPVTTIAGPSATADIEMTRVKGVHGPRVLDVIIVAV